MDFYIPPQCKKIVVSISGGADSAFLFYTTIKYVKQNLPNATVSAFTCSNGAKLNWNARRAAAVIDYVLRRWEFNNFDMHYTFYRDEQKDEYFWEVLKLLYEKDLVDCFVDGTTSNPPLDATTFNQKGEKIYLRKHHGIAEWRNDYSAEFKEEIAEDRIFINAWTGLDKKFIADQYKKYNLEKDLLPLTRSCEARPHFYNYDKKIVGKELERFEQPCGMCWWCLEKKWAFGHF